jgi:hypothetical protein
MIRKKVTIRFVLVPPSLSDKGGVGTVWLKGAPTSTRCMWNVLWTVTNN